MRRRAQPQPRVEFADTNRLNRMEVLSEETENSGEGATENSRDQAQKPRTKSAATICSNWGYLTKLRKTGGVNQWGAGVRMEMIWLPQGLEPAALIATFTAGRLILMVTLHTKIARFINCAYSSHSSTRIARQNNLGLVAVRNPYVSRGSCWLLVNVINRGRRAVSAIRHGLLQ
jgi:hypothetical protein